MEQINEWLDEIDPEDDAVDDIQDLNGLEDIILYQTIQYHPKKRYQTKKQRNLLPLNGIVNISQENEK